MDMEERLHPAGCMAPQLRHRGVARVVPSRWAIGSDADDGRSDPGASAAYLRLGLLRALCPTTPAVILLALAIRHTGRVARIVACMGLRAPRLPLAPAKVCVPQNCRQAADAMHVPPV